MTKNNLYPLKFVPRTTTSVWGSSDILLCGFKNISSIVSNGFLEKNSIFDVMETYMGDLIGEDLYKKFGYEFPLLLKHLNIKDVLSIQVHPDDETAFDRHNSYGKHEAWYILEADANAKIFMGLNTDMLPGDFYNLCKNHDSGDIEKYINVYHPKKGDFFYIPAGTVHAAGFGLKIVEIQQLSDVTYRLYDWGRDKTSTPRETHLDLAFDCIDYKKYDPGDKFIPAALSAGKEKMTLTNNKYFTINLLQPKGEIFHSADQDETFVLYYCIEGGAELLYDNKTYGLEKGEWILIPATFSKYTLTPKQKDSRFLETYILQEEEEDNYINKDVAPCLEKQ